MSNLFGLKVGEVLTTRIRRLSPRSYHELKRARTCGAYSILLFLLIVAALAILALTFVRS